MTLDDLNDLLDRCGGDPDRWPPGAEPQMRRLLAASSDGRVALARARTLDRALEATRVRAAPVVALPRATSAPQARPITGLTWGVRTAGLAAAAAATLCVGVAFGAAERTTLSPDEAAAVALHLPAEAGDVG